MNTVNSNTATIVQKEEIPNISFPIGDVLTSEIKKAERVSRIRKAKKLGNSFKGKVKIIFEDTTGTKKVETTVWGVTEKNIILKKNTLIPIRCIHEIKFY
jgi:tRNA A37 threonylcarbamoyladenosine synthetase subunit TsaC/SUA5/YrdC